MGNTIESNLIGLSSVGGSLPNTSDGVDVALGASGNFVGLPGLANFISNNQGNGVRVESYAFGNFIQGNVVGTSLVLQR
jgi:hypothetical protein